MDNQLIVIGGGASGLMAAITAAKNGGKVTVLEQNEKPGRKLLATGNGKCNLTNLDLSASHYRGGASRLTERIFSAFTNRDAIAFFQGIGLKTLDRNGWVYPYTEQASQVLRLLLLEAEKYRVKIKSRERVTAVIPRDGRFLVSTPAWTYEADHVIIATGSPASAVRGASGDAIQFARALHIETVPFLPALVPLRIREDVTNRWAGTRVHASVSLYIDAAFTASDTGEVQLTDFGISGIPVFQVSRYAAEGISRGRKVSAVLDFMPDVSEEDLADDLEKRAALRPGSPFQELLTGLLPDKLTALFGGRTGHVSENTSSRNGRDYFLETARHIKRYTVTIAGTASIKQAQICSGGIPAEELTDHLECRKIPGLYFAGEAVDVDGECGGYNLQWAWSSGYVAGISCLTPSTAHDQKGDTK
ncbi:MAG: NAD(P)/FAD-dependent oxidoreductase [Bilifractor sp.]|jgi:predicted Rossmann fold flavoprotein